MNTRFNNDPARQEKALSISTGLGRYMLDTPGTGEYPEFIADPSIRLQKFAGNMTTHAVDVQSRMRHLGQSLTRDCTVTNTLGNNATPISYPVYDKEVTAQPRATHPAWAIRECSTTRWEYPLWNPQTPYVATNREYNNTRAVHKDSYSGGVRCV